MILKNIKKKFSSTGLIVIFFCIFFSSFIFNLNLFANNVEDVFSDIKNNYIYYNELQTLYDNSYFVGEKKFNPTDLLSKEDFQKIISKYNPDSTYFCDSSNSIDCLEKTSISLEKALEVLFVNSGLFSLSQNDEIIQKINSGEITQKLLDVGVKNTDGTPNYFYGFLKEAYEKKYSEIKIDGTKKDYFLVNQSGNINPKKSLTKQEFLNIFYIFFKLTQGVVIQNDEDNSSNLSNKKDTDGDLVYDNIDRCVFIKGTIENSGCPILDGSCVIGSEMNNCKSGYFCNEKGYCEVKKEVLKTCIYPKNGSSVFGNVICDKCPCDYKLNFLAVLKKCDLIIPAIVSKNGDKIFSKGEPYELPYSYGK